MKKVGAGHFTASYLKPGLEGEFHFLKLGRLGFILYAIKTAAGEKLYEADGFNIWIRKMRISGGVLALLFVPLSLVGLLFGGGSRDRCTNRVRDVETDYRVSEGA